MRTLVYQTHTDDKAYIEAAGADVSEAPTTGVISGSLYYEDGGKVYMFSETTSEWGVFADLGGSGA